MPSTAIDEAEREIGMPANVQGSFQGTAAGVPGVAGATSRS